MGGLAAYFLLLYRSRAAFIGLGVKGFVRRGTQSFGYIVILMLMSGFGGFLVILYVASGVEIVPILAFQIGASTPLIITNFAATAPVPVRENA